MTDTMIVELGLQAMTIAAKMAAPVLLTALVVGFAISLFQSVTQIQEATLSFVPKAAACGAALLFSGNWDAARDGHLHPAAVREAAAAAWQLTRPACISLIGEYRSAGPAGRRSGTSCRPCGE
jgi:flagellar biosynthetic protein FliQ